MLEDRFVHWLGLAAVVVSLVGVLALPMLLLLGRDWVRNARRSARQKRFRQSLPSSGQDWSKITVTIYPKKGDLLKMFRAEESAKVSPLFRGLALMLIALWVVAVGWNVVVNFGSWFADASWLDIYQVFLGTSLACIGVWSLVLRPTVIRRNIARISDSQSQSNFKVTYTFSPSGIHISDHDQQADYAWEGVRRVKQTADAAQIQLEEGDLIWIPQDSLFLDGDWEELQNVLRPLSV